MKPRTLNRSYVVIFLLAMHSLTELALCTGALSFINTYWILWKCLAKTDQRLLLILQYIFGINVNIYISLSVHIPFIDTHRQIIIFRCRRDRRHTGCALYFSSFFLHIQTILFFSNYCP